MRFGVGESQPPEPWAWGLRVQKLSYWVPIVVEEERLNNLSDLAIGEAMGGDIGDALAAAARHNLAVLAEMQTNEPDETLPITDPATLPVDVPDGDVGATEPDEPAEGEPE